MSAEPDEIPEGDTAFADAGVSLSDLAAQGYFDRVTPAHREKARKYWAKVDAARASRDLFS